jgi:hypothetical protein
VPCGTASPIPAARRRARRLLREPPHRARNRAPSDRAPA